MKRTEADIRGLIEEGRSVLGIEFGSTRIKAVLVDEEHTPIAAGSFSWENQLVDGLWTYDLDLIFRGLSECYRALKADVLEKYGVILKRLGTVGISAMMHGYMALNKAGELLVPFRTWRNTNTGKAAQALTQLFDFNIPLRWSIAHLYEAILDGEPHVAGVDFMTTLAGYIHWKLTGRRVIGIGDASGMFPIDSQTKNYDERMLGLFEETVKPYGFSWNIRTILPKVLAAGEQAGTLSEAGAHMLDAEGDLLPGCPMCPPEGDAGTGMTATNSVAVGTGNVSAGTSVFAMLVLGQALTKVYGEIDMVTTPDGAPVAMVHCNNCTSDINAWVGLFKDFAQTFGFDVDMDQLYTKLFQKALEG